FQVTVRQPNALPVITSTPPLQAVQGLPIVYRMRAQDTAGEGLSFRLDVGPTGMTLDPVTGLLRWTPAANQVGTQSVTLTVLDSRGGQTMQTFSVQVVAAATNDPPTIQSTPRTTIHLGGQYAYQVQATDPNADPLTYSLTMAPAGMTIDA